MYVANTPSMYGDYIQHAFAPYNNIMIPVPCYNEWTPEATPEKIKEWCEEWERIGDQCYQFVRAGHPLIVPGYRPNQKHLERSIGSLKIHHSMGDRKPKLGKTGCIQWQKKINHIINICKCFSGRAPFFTTLDYNCGFNCDRYKLNVWHHYLTTQNSALRGTLLQHFNKEFQQYLSVCL